MDVLRDEFIRHMFSGACVLCPGPDCQAVVEGERWPQSMGICVIGDVIAALGEKRGGRSDEHIPYMNSEVTIIRNSQHVSQLMKKRFS